MKNKLPESLQSQLDEISQHKIRFAILLFALLILTGIAVSDNFAGEEISLDNSAQVEQVVDENVTPNKNLPVSAANVKIVLGANANELYIGDPFQKPQEPSTPAQVEDSPVEVGALNFTPPNIPTQETPKPHEKIILRGTATGANPTALVEIFSEDDGKVVNKNLLLGIGDELDGRQIVAITNEFIIFNDGARMHVNTEMP